MARSTFRFRTAAALILLLPLPLACQYEDVVRQVSQPNYTHYLNELLFTRAGDSRGPGSAQHEAARTNIRDTLAAFGLNVTLERFEYRGDTFYNVTAVLPGKTRPDEYHVFGAHYDSLNNPGADDDASGIAALLEVARVASLHEFAASLVFVAFDLEEAGLIGSGAWAAAHSGDRILSMLQMDMVGYNAPGETHNLIALAVPNLSLSATLPVLQGAVEQYGGLMSTVYLGLAFSDHFAFAWVAPSVLMIEAGFHQNGYYHGAADSIDTPHYIDYEFAAAVTRSAVGYMAQEAGLLPGDSWTARLNSGGVYNSASFIVGTVAPAELVTLFGSAFGEKPTVAVRDSAGREQPAPVSYSSPAQINVRLPAELAAGAATIAVTRDDGLRLTAPLNVEAIAPGVFTAECSGLGAPAAQAVRVAPDGGQTVQYVFACAAASTACLPAPVDFGGDGDRLVLVLYGTGIRGRSDVASVSLDVDGQKFPAQYAGAHSVYPGLDQVNIELPRALRGKGRTLATLRVDGKAANPVAIDFGKP
ncbi:MAG: M28 family peptidase [Acidobacteriia bacterium]|nr:M28 family peptidase [Terriglobia bacterium]